MALVLMYHNIVEGDKERAGFHPAHRPYVLTREEFTTHIQIAQELGYRFLAVDDLYGDSCRDKLAILLTFDDSWENHCACDVMDESGIQGIFFLNSGDVGWEGRLTAEEVAGMAEGGHEIGSHGVNHEFLTNLDEGGLRESLSESKTALEEMSGRPVRFLSAVGGRYNALAAKIAREVGYEACFVSWPGFLGRVGDDFLVKRISIAAAMEARRFTSMLKNPLPLVLHRKMKYRLRLLASPFSRARGDEGH